ncbi:MAG: hypothetical protein GC181_07995 [Bacteroidetes bacterium]|nr:hypothetical protein [Bacteroidota bacterium]
MKRSIFFLSLVCSFFSALAQNNVGIGTNQPDPSAALEIKSGNQGILIPRTDSTSRKSISDPADGLMVYDTTTSSFWYFNGDEWQNMKKAVATAIADDGLSLGDTCYFSPFDDASFEDADIIDSKAHDNWQSFTALSTGYLVRFDAYILPNSSPFDGGVFRVYAGTGTSGTLLYESYIDSLGEGWLEFEIPHETVLVEKDSIYTFFLNDTVNSCVWIYNEFGNLYAGGEASSGVNSDYLFRTTVNRCVNKSVITTDIDNQSATLQLIDTIFFKDNTWQISAETDDQLLSLTSDSLTIEDGNTIDLSAYKQSLNLSGDTLTLSNGNSVVFDDKVNDADYDPTNEIQTLTLNGDTLILSSGNSVVFDDKVNDADSSATNELQFLSLSNDTLYLSSGNYVVLSSVNTDNQTLSFSNDTLSLSNGNNVVLTSINTDNQTLSFSNDTLSLSNGNTVVLTSINSDNQTLSISNDSLVIDDGNAVDLSAYLDNTDAQLLEFSNDSLSIANGNSVDLSGYLDNTDSQMLSLSNDSLSIENGNTIDLSAYLDNTDAQVFSLEEDTLTISGGNSIDLSSIDNQQLSVSNDTLRIANGNSVKLSHSTDLGILLSDECYKIEYMDIFFEKNTSVTLDSTTSGWQSFTAEASCYLTKVIPYIDSSALYHAGNFKIYEGDGTSGQLLYSSAQGSLGPGWDTIYVADGAVYVDSGSHYTIYLEDTIGQFIWKSRRANGGYTGGGSDEHFNLGDRFFRIKGGSCDFRQLVEPYSGSGTTSLHYVDTIFYSNGEYSTGESVLSISNDSLSITHGNTVDLSTYLDNTDEQTLSISSDSLSITGGNTVDLSDYLDNTDEQTLSISNDSLSITGGNAVDLSEYLDNQTLSITNDSLSIVDGNSVDLSDYLDNTDNQTLSISNDSLLISGGNSVDLSAYLDNTDDQNLSLSNDSLSIDNGSTLDLSSITPTTLADDDGNTTIEVEASANEDKIHFKLGGTEYYTFESTGMRFINPNGNLSIGSNNLLSITSGNTNVGLGDYALRYDSSGSSNIAIGIAAMQGNRSGSNNVAIGYRSGFVNSTGSGNVFLGYRSGFTETGSNKLYIENSDVSSTQALIYGEFDNDFLAINGDLRINDGTQQSGYVFTSDADGDGSWQAPVDDQKIDKFNLNGTTLEISLEDDGEADKTVDLSNLGVPVGSVQMYAGDTSMLPTGWLVCNGNTFSSSTYPTLYTVLGNSNVLPNMSGRFPLGVGSSGSTYSSTHTLGDTAGDEKHKLTIDEMPSHTHDAGSLSTQFNYLSGNSGAGSSTLKDGSDSQLYNSSALSGSTSSKGNDYAHSIMPPYFTVYFIIKAK